jgi:hypothetical protein
VSATPLALRWRWPVCGKTAIMRVTTLATVCDGETVRKVEPQPEAYVAGLVTASTYLDHRWRSHLRSRRAAMSYRYATRQACRPVAVAMDMMDNASALPTCPQRQQQHKTAVRKWAKITHTTSRTGFISSCVMHFTF